MAMKNGGKVMLHAMAQDTEEDVMPMPEGKMPKRDRPMSLERTFHVTQITEHKEKPMAKTAEAGDAIGYLKKQQKNKMSGGREVT